MAWKLVSEAVRFSRCNALVFVVQEQSEMNNWSFFYFFMLNFCGFVLWFCFFFLKTSVYWRLGLFLKTLCFSTEYRTSLSFKSEHWELKWLSLPCLGFLMWLARKFMLCKTSSYGVTIYRHLLTTCIGLKLYTHRPWHNSNTTTPKPTFTVWNTNGLQGYSQTNRFFSSSYTQMPKSSGGVTV